MENSTMPRERRRHKQWGSLCKPCLHQPELCSAKPGAEVILGMEYVGTRGNVQRIGRSRTMTAENIVPSTWPEGPAGSMNVPRFEIFRQSTKSNRPLDHSIARVH